MAYEDDTNQFPEPEPQPQSNPLPGRVAGTGRRQYINPKYLVYPEIKTDTRLDNNREIGASFVAPKIHDREYDSSLDTMPTRLKPLVPKR